MVLLFFPFFSKADWFTSDGKTYEECMENRRKSINNQSQLRVASGYCRSKHPIATSTYEYNKTQQVLAAGSNNSRLINFTTNIIINKSAIKHFGEDYGYGIKSNDYRFYDSVEVTNRNEFPINGIIVGLLSKSEKMCSWDDKAYKEIYSCDGVASAKQSASFVCNIPDVEKKAFSTCIIGFSVNATDSVFKQVILGQ